MADSRTIRTTIELSGEGSYRAKLKEVQAGLKNAASAQKVVDAQYDKSDRSLAALTARQGAYQDKLALQKQKLELVEQEYRKVVAAEGENSESARRLANEYNNTSAQVINTERQLAEVADAMDKAANSADDAGDAAGEAAKDVKSFGSASETAAKNAKKITDAADAQRAALKKVGEQAEKTAAKLSKAMGAAIAGAVTVGVKSFMDFESEMSMVDTLADKNVLSLEELSDQALETARRTGLEAKNIAASAYGALSAGVDTGNVMSFMEASGKAAKAGKAALDDAIDGATSAMNAWKIAYSEADNVYAKFLVAQDKGKTTLGEMAKQMGQVTGLAPQLGIGLDEVLASVAALTKNGVQTNSAFTGLKAIMSGVLKPTADAKKEAARLGLEFSAAALQAKGLTGFLADVQEKTQGNSDSIAKLFGNVEGLSKVLLLGNAAAADYDDALSAMSNTTGKLDAAFATVTDNRAARLSMALNNLKVNGIQFGRSLAPYVDMGSEALGRLSDRLSKLSEAEMRSLLQTGLWITGALGVVGAIGKIATASKTLMLAFSGPTGWIALGVAGLAALIVGLKALSDRLPSVKKSMDGLFENTDEDALKRFDVTFAAQASATVSIGDAQGKIKAAVDEIKGALMGIDGLDANEQAAIVSAIASGSGLDLLSTVLDGYGVPSGKAAGIAASYTEAMQTISSELSKLELSEDAQAKIREVAASGGDVQAALEGYGVAPGAASAVSGKITDAMGKVDSALRDVGIGPDTRAKLMAGMVDDERLIRQCMLALDVPEDVVDQVMRSYSSVTGTLTGQITGLYDKISAALTDGKPDTPEVKAALEQQVRDFYGSAIRDVESWANEEIAKLNVNSATYDQDVENIKAKGAEMKTSLQTQQAETLQFLSEMSGKSTEEVEKRLGELGAIEEAVKNTIAEIERARQVAGEEGAQASRITKQGAATNVETAARAFAYEKTTKDSRLDAIEAQYKADQLALEAKYDELGKAEYERQSAALAEQYKTDTEGALTAYQTSIGELLAGLGASLERTSPEMAERLKALIEGLSLGDKIAEALADDGEISPEEISQPMRDRFQEVMGYALQVDELYNTGNQSELITQLNAFMDAALEDAATGLEGVDLGFIDEALEGAIKNGVFDGVDGIDVSSSESKLKALFGGLGENAVAGYTEAMSAGKTASGAAGSEMAEESAEGARTALDEHSPSKVFMGIGENAVAGMTTGINGKARDVYNAALKMADGARRAARTIAATDFRLIGRNAGDGLAGGLNDRYQAVYNAARRLAQAATQGARITLEVHSPSKVFERIGGFTAEGLIRGVNAKAGDVDRAMREMVSPTGAARQAARGAESARQAPATPQQITKVDVRYSGAFSRSEARRFGRTLTDVMAAEAAARGAR